MGKQLQRGTQFPFRPATMIVALTSGAFTLPRDTPPVDWTAAGTKFPLGTVSSEVMDDRNHITLDAVNDEIDLRAGIYEIDVSLPVLNNDAANNESVRFAITNSDGSVVHLETPSEVMRANERTTGFMRHLLHLTTDQAIVIRGAQVTDTGGTDNLVIATAPDACITVRRIGNVNES